MLNNFLSNQEYFFVIHPKSEYNTTGKYELHSLDSEEPIMTGYFKILKAILVDRFMAKFFY